MAGTAFSTSNWDGYDEATVSNPSSALTDFSLLIDISRLSSDWKSNVQSDGGDIRITKGDDTELAFDLIDWAYNAGSPTGWIRVLWSGSLASTGTQTVKTWSGYNAGGSASAYGATETYGSDNAYASHWLVYLPDGGGADRTPNSHDGTGSGGVSIGGAAGKVGAATEYDAIDDVSTVSNTAAIQNGIDNDFSVLAWFRYSDLTLTDSYVVGQDQTTVNWWQFGVRGDFLGATLDDDSTKENLRSSGFDFDTNGSNNTWYHVGMARNQGTDVKFFVDGTVDSSQSSSNGGVSTSDDMTIGLTNVNSNMGSGQSLTINELQIHSTLLSDDWIAHEYDQSDDQATFWGTWTWNAAGGGGATTGTVSATATLSGTLTAKGNLAGSADGQASTAAQLSGKGSLDGSIVASATLSATLSAKGTLAGAASGQASTSGSLSNAANDQVSGSASATGTLSGTLLATGSLAGSADGQGTTSGTLTGQGSLSGSAAGTSTLSATLSGGGAVIGSISGQSQLDGVLSALGLLSGSVDATATASGGLRDSASNQMAGSVTGISSLSGTLSGKGGLSGSSDAVGSLNGEVRDAAPIPISGTAAANASLAALLSARGTLAGTINAASATNARLEATVHISGSLAASATLAAALRDNNALPTAGFIKLRNARLRTAYATASLQA